MIYVDVCMGLCGYIGSVSGMSVMVVNNWLLNVDMNGCMFVSLCFE